MVKRLSVAVLNPRLFTLQIQYYNTQKTTAVPHKLSGNSRRLAFKADLRFINKKGLYNSF